MNRLTSPYRCHLFICGNDRQGARKSCADGGAGPAIKDLLKQQVAARGWKGRVRVSQSGCLGLCERGPNVMIYPQGLWFSAVAPADAEAILAEVGKLLS
ncbi:MAG: (2Fe-2S) ferredoxin domain-containing protein [Kiritimatiellae bacterium]|nr:(2Fe-2S) ferredoxin domain-containing protein [Kiritimatiellia bacterium]